MAAPYRVNFKKVFRNVDLYQVFTLLSAPSTPVNIGGATFFMMVRPKVGTPTPVLSLSLGSGLQLVTDGTDGKIAINVNHTVMEAIPLGSYKYDLVMDRGGASEIVMYGDFKVVDGVTDLA